MTKILLVDDATEIINLLVFILKTQRYDIITASNERDALQCYEGHQPDLIIMDLTMPLMSGVELIKKIRSQSNAVPILALSGNAEVTGCPQQNILLLQKPVSVTDILSAIKKLLSLKLDGSELEVQWRSLFAIDKKSTTKFCDDPFVEL